MSHLNANIAKKNKISKEEKTYQEKYGRYHFGRYAELIVSWLLLIQGYHLLAKRYRTSVGELDLVVSKGNYLVFVEVKARRQATQLHEAITPKQQQRIINAAKFFVACHHQYNQHDIRFDVVWVQPWRWPQHIRHAWLI